MVVLVADGTMESVVKTLLARYRPLKIRPVEFDIYRHPEHDPGCLNKSHTFLKTFLRSHRHALVLFDHDGCGRQEAPAQRLEKELVTRCDDSGWGGRAGAIVIEPELEAWVWNRSPHVAACLGWASPQELARWLDAEGFAVSQHGKRARPKEAMGSALRKVRKPWSSATHAQIAQRVSLSRCADNSFLRFCQTLRSWFPE